MPSTNTSSILRPHQLRTGPPVFGHQRPLSPHAPPLSDFLHRLTGGTAPQAPPKPRACRRHLIARQSIAPCMLQLPLVPALLMPSPPTHDSSTIQTPFTGKSASRSFTVWMPEGFCDCGWWALRHSCPTSGRACLQCIPYDCCFELRSERFRRV